MRLLDAEAIATALTPSVAADLLESELHAGLDPEADPPRSVLPAAAGELLVMPSTAGAVGVKLATVAPANPARGLPRIQGAYVLFDPGTLAPVAVLDAAALTAVRTAAVSALAVRFLAAHDASRLLVWGTGPQAWAHVEAVAAERPVTRVDVAARDPARRDQRPQPAKPGDPRRRRHAHQRRAAGFQRVQHRRDHQQPGAQYGGDDAPLHRVDGPRQFGEIVRPHRQLVFAGDLLGQP